MAVEERDPGIAIERARRRRPVGQDEGDAVLPGGLGDRLADGDVEL
jgi:hypothetical protein